VSYRLTLLACLILACLPASAIERGVMLREGVIYVSPSTDSAKLSNIGRGREVAVMQHAPGWVNVMGTVGAGYAPEDPETETDRNVTGWIEDKGVITTLTPDGDKILFGEAFDCEMEASKRGGRAAPRRMPCASMPASPNTSRNLRWPPSPPTAPPTFAGRLKPPMPPTRPSAMSAIPPSATRSTKTA
jgi:hypothetical protein